MTRPLLIVGLFFLVACAAFAGSKKIYKPDVMNETKPAQEATGKIPAMPPDLLPRTTLVGNYTTLSGYYDYQINGGAAQHIRVNPANGNIHVVYMADPDSPAVVNTPSRSTRYAFSTNGGTTWNNFSNLRVPDRRSGFPTLDLGTGSFAGAAIIANHSIIGGPGNQATIYVDFPEGGGSFSEISPPTGFGSDEGIWPFIASASDGSVILKASRQTALTNHYARTSDFVSWSPFATFPLAAASNNVGGRYPTHANGTGRVGILLQAVASGTFFLESTNNGVTWPASATEIHPASPPGRVSGVDTFQCYVGADFVYNGNTPLFVVDELGVGANEPNEGAQIAFYSAPTGWKNIATHANTPNCPDNRAVAQSNHFTIGYPAIGMSGSTIVVIYVAMQNEVSPAGGFNYCDIFALRSTNSGTTWSTPYNVTQTADVDERYPAISPWNENGFANITWQEDPQPGSAAFTDLAPLTRARQKFLKLNLSLLTFTGVGESETETATSFKIAQNYPNPFNPATKIDYTVEKAGFVSIKVFNTLGQEVATLLNQELQPGSYQVTFDGSALSSGVYIYKMTAGGFSQTRKMVLAK